MCAPKWTPGPWHVVDGKEVAAQDGGVAEIVTWYRDHDEIVANANLIAAAPDLYRELENLVELAEAAMRAANRDGGEYDIEAELAGARAALAKARGEVTTSGD